MAGREQCIARTTAASSSSHSAAVYRCIKQSFGCTLRGLHHKRHLVTTRKQGSHKFPRIEGSFSGPQGVRAFEQGPDCVSGDRQHHSCCLHKQGDKYEIRLSLCPPLETALLVQSQANSAEGHAHTGSSELASIADPDRVVPPTGGVRPLMCMMAHSSGRPVCYQIQPQASPVHVSGSGSDGLEGGCFESSMGGAGCLCFSCSISPRSGGLQGSRPRLLMDYSDCPGMAKHALVLRSGQHAGSSYTVATTGGKSADSALQRVPSQGPFQLESACLAPQAESIQQ